MSLYLLACLFVRGPIEMKNVPKVEKVHNFFDPHPHSLSMIWTLLNVGKIGNSMTPPLGPNLEKIWNWEKFEFWEPPIGRKPISLKHFLFKKSTYNWEKTKKRSECFCFNISRNTKPTKMFLVWLEKGCLHVHSEYIAWALCNKQLPRYL